MESCCQICSRNKREENQLLCITCLEAFPEATQCRACKRYFPSRTLHFTLEQDRCDYCVKRKKKKDKIKQTTKKFSKKSKLEQILNSTEHHNEENYDSPTKRIKVKKQGRKKIKDDDYDSPTKHLVSVKKPGKKKIKDFIGGENEDEIKGSEIPEKKQNKLTYIEINHDGAIIGRICLK